MSGPSNIEWTGHTWNPIAGCSVLTPGCTNCYAMKMAARLEAMGQELYRGLTKPSKAGAVWTGTVRLAPESVLLAPLKRKKPTTYFVNSMSDLFHESVPDEWIDKVFAVMALCPQHTFQVLTKRAERMLRYVAPFAEQRIWAAQFSVKPDFGHKQYDWPLPNVWLGVSTERQQEADERIPLLLQTPAAVRFISAEPLIGPIDLQSPGYTGFAGDGGPHHEARLDWVIVGGESGPDARRFDLEWADSIVAQCKAADVPCFVKQLGSNPFSSGHPHGLIDRKGGDPDEWPARLAIREMPQPAKARAA